MKYLLVGVCAFLSLSAEAAKCRKPVSSQAFRALRRVTDEVTGGGWNRIDLVTEDEKREALRSRGRTVAVLVDGENASERELVMGYLYNVEVVQGEPIPFADYLRKLTPAERRAATRNRRVGPETLHIPTARTLVIALRPPRYRQDHSSGLARWESLGWASVPREEDIVRIPFGNIRAAKYYVDYR